jgi:hypothetical protein
MYTVIESNEPPAELDLHDAARRAAAFAVPDDWSFEAAYREALGALQDEGRFDRTADDGRSRILITRNAVNEKR